MKIRTKKPILIWSDLHLGHANILKFCKEKNSRWWAGDTIQEHDCALEKNYLDAIEADDQVVFFLGDVAMNAQALRRIGTWPGRKLLVRGNHDVQSESVYREVFEWIHGLMKFRRHWFCHAPVHPMQTRNLRCIHGHCHDNTMHNNPTLEDGRPTYVNVTVESTGGKPVPLDDVISGKFKPLY